MNILKYIPHPLVRLRNILIKRYPLPESRIQEAAAARGLIAVPHDVYMTVTEQGPVAKRRTPALEPYRIQRVALGSNGLAFQHRLQAILTSLNVPSFPGGAADAQAGMLNVSEADQSIVFAMIKNWFAGDSSVGVKTADGYGEAVELFFSRDLGPITYLTLCVVEQQAGAVKYCSTVVLNFWGEKTQYGEDSIFESSVVNPYVKRIKSTTYRDLQRGALSIDDVSSQVTAKVDFPIDVVYTWVNDKDEEWNQERNAFAVDAGRGPRGRSTHAERFKNRDELKYSLRSLELFAPFVRNIYLVTNGQVPSWLNPHQERLKVISHKEIFTDPSVLPTFNSSGIETQLHRIPGLSEHFLYFNDDFFLGRLTEASDFFFANGVLKYFPTEQRVFEPEIDENSEEYIIADANAIKLMAAKYGRYNREIMMHAPYPCSTSLLNRMQEEWHDHYHACASQRFRSEYDLRPIAFMQYHAGYQQRLAIPSSISHRYLALWKTDIDKQLSNVLESKSFKTFCINDVGVAEDRAEWTDSLVASFLQSYFPMKSGFEL